MSDIRIIKKYPNRRLYDSTVNAYITLDDIKQLVIDRVEFQVVDAKTGKDITQTTLLQIITESEMGATPIFTSDMLQNFIRFYHDKSQDVFSKYLEEMMGLFVQQREMVSNQWETYQAMFMGKKPDKKKK
jgi:polyhydroxyalkanoate synthesis repressor PhaR